MTAATMIDNDTDIQLEITRDVDAPPLALFNAWADETALRQWMGPQSKSCPDATTNAVVGGTFKIPMIGEDGSAHTAVGTYSEVDSPRRLSFSWSWLQDDGTPGQEMHIILDFKPLSDTRTRFTLRQINFINDEARDNHNDGWNGSLMCLEQYLTSAH